MARENGASEERTRIVTGMTGNMWTIRKVEWVLLFGRVGTNIVGVTRTMKDTAMER